MASNEKIMEVVSLLCEAFGRKPTELTIAVYKLAMSDVSDNSLMKAASKAARECKYMPTPAELREWAGCVPEADRGLLAWAAVERSISIGPYKPVDFDDRAINATIRNLGGWVSFLSRFTSAAEEKWVRQEFLKCYASLAKSAIGDEEGAPLAGLADVVFIDGKMAPPKPILIESKTGRVDPPRIGGGDQRPRIASRGGEPKRIGEAGR
jgi:hypothetical protein